jgi:serine/threonine protein kinase
MGCGGSKPETFAKQEAKSQSPPTKGKSPSKSREDSAPPKAVNGERKTGSKTVMGIYTMAMAKDAIMGEGTSSICRRGNDEKGKDIAIKVYKEQAKGGSKVKEVTLQKFKRQISVLQELMEPFKPPSDPNLWNEELKNVKPSRVFMQLLDYSKSSKGPGPDASDGVLYVVTELARYSLKDFLAQRREQAKPLSKEEINNMAKAILIAMAGLHAKGFVHIDMKPENMMDFDGKLKVIDVDGCVRAGTKVSIQDSSISFSPCYCAPEWARFLIKDNQPNIQANPALDVWSVGMTLCELVSLDAILKPQYANFLRNASSHREAGFLFMEWLSSIRKAPLPKSVANADSGLVDLLVSHLLVCNQQSRKTCAQCLSHAYVKAGKWEADPSIDKTKGTECVRIQRDRPEDESTLQPLYKGSLWKLNTTGNKSDPNHWIKRDMWIAHNHSLCYYSKKEDKKLVLIDGPKLTSSSMHKVGGGDCAKEYAFEIRTASDEDTKESNSSFLAAESPEELADWLEKLGKVTQMDMVVTFKLGSKMADDLKAFKINVSNRRMKVEDESKDQFEPKFKSSLFKLKTEGDVTKLEDWFERDFWIAVNGSMVYFSPKEDRDLVYYTASDVARAKVTVKDDGETCRKNVFQVQLPPVNGVEFAPGVFSCDSEEQRKKWIAQFKQASSTA